MRREGAPSEPSEGLRCTDGTTPVVWEAGGETSQLLVSQCPLTSPTAMARNLRAPNGHDRFPTAHAFPGRTASECVLALSGNVALPSR